jgi:hypothetical protein
MDPLPQDLRPALAAAGLTEALPADLK